MPWLRTGTVSVTNGSPAITFTGVDLVANRVQPSDAILLQDGRWYELLTVGANSATIAPNYLGATATGQAYAIIPTNDRVGVLGQAAQSLITDFSTVRDNAGQGIFSGGSAAAPTLRRSDDLDTGLFLEGGNTASIVTGGTRRLTVTDTALTVNVAATINGNVTLADATAAANGDRTRTIRAFRSGVAYHNLDLVGWKVNVKTGGAEAQAVVFDENGNTGIGGSPVAAERLSVQGNLAGYVQRLYNANASPAGILMFYQNAAPNGTGNEFFRGLDTGGDRFVARSNGGLANFSANNVNLSDEREKEGVTPFDAAADLDAFLAFPFVNYKYRDQTHDDFNLGTAAQTALVSHPGNARFVDPDSWQKPKVDASGAPVLEDAFDADGKPVMEPTGLLDADEQPILRQAKRQATESRMSVYDGDIHYRTGAQAQFAHRRINELEAKLAAALARIETLEAR